MDLEKQRAFIIRFIFFSIVILGTYLFFRYAMYYIMPFLIGFLIAFMLQPFIKRMTSLIKLPKKFCAIISFLLFYFTIGLFITLLTIRGYHFVNDFLKTLPALYTSEIQPALYDLMRTIEIQIGGLNPELVTLLNTAINTLYESLSGIINSLSSAILPIFTGFAGSIPSVFVSVFFTILSSLFFTIDYQKITSFLVYQFPKRGREILINVKGYITGSVLQLLKAYGKLMSLTFLELALGLTILGVENAIVIAFIIAIFDILPFLGTGGVMIPWVIFMFLGNNTKMAIGLLILYLIITLIRNVLEPKLVGQQIGIHPLLMLVCMYLGGRLFGVLGIFLLPLIIIVIQNLNESGTIHLYRSTHKTPENK